MIQVPQAEAHSLHHSSDTLASVYDARILVPTKWQTSEKNRKGNQSLCRKFADWFYPVAFETEDLVEKILITLKAI